MADAERASPRPRQRAGLSQAARSARQQWRSSVRPTRTRVAVLGSPVPSDRAARTDGGDKNRASARRRRSGGPPRRAAHVASHPDLGGRGGRAPEKPSPPPPAAARGGSGQPRFFSSRRETADSSALREAPPAAAAASAPAPRNLGSVGKRATEKRGVERRERRAAGADMRQRSVHSCIAPRSSAKTAQNSLIVTRGKEDINTAEYATRQEVRVQPHPSLISAD